MHQVLFAFLTMLVLAGVGVFVARVPLATARRVWLILFTCVIAGAVTMMVAHAFVTRWGIRLGVQRDGLFSLIDGTAWRPFVYRRLTFDIVGWTSQLIEQFGPRRAVDTFVDQTLRDVWPNQIVELRLHRIEATVAHLLNWLTLFATVPVLAAWLTAVLDCSWLEALIGACLAMALVPLTLIHGGYIYDSMELLLWTALLVCIAKRWLFAVPFLFLLLSFNKESALALVPVLFPLLTRVVTRRRAVLWSLALGVLAAAWLVFIRHRYQSSAGAAQEWSVRQNLEFWSNPLTYFKVAPLFSPGIPAPRSGNVAVLLLLLIPLRFGFRQVQSDVKWAAIIAGAMMLPLFIISGATDETRVLGPLFPFLLAISFEGVQQLFDPRKKRQAVRAT